MPPRLPALLLGAFLPMTSAAHAAPDYAASGFTLQALVGGTVPLVSALGGGAAAPVGPTVRLGLSTRPIFLAASVSYIGLSDAGAEHGGLHMVTAGIDLMPHLWHHRDGRARLYLLFGGNAGVAIQPGRDGEPLTSTVSGGFSVGVGGQYFLHPGYALGVELGARTQLWRPEGTLGASAGLYGALSGTFVAGGG